MALIEPKMKCVETWSRYLQGQNAICYQSLCVLCGVFDRQII